MSANKFLRYTAVPALLAAGFTAANVNAQDTQGDATRGEKFFQVSCAVCHSPVLGPENLVIMKQGPSLVGVVGRKAGSLPHFNYTQAIQDSGLTWDTAALNKFLVNPMVAVPGTAMPIPVPDGRIRADVIAYLATLKVPEGVTLKFAELPTGTGGKDPNDWQLQAPGTQHRFKVAELPAPFATTSAGNGPRVVPAPDNAV
ncbi:MAG TPA: hypothetical protein VKV04_13230, partial [Verrucomicrobiae bacterium]|nr:hypothetical protein [Verrucomicrobiae bacterium]